MTISKGEVIVVDNQFLGKRGAGNFIRRRIDPEYLKSFGL
jgi:dihydropyrimidinase